MPHPSEESFVTVDLLFRLFIPGMFFARSDDFFVLRDTGTQFFTKISDLSAVGDCTQLLDVFIDRLFIPAVILRQGPGDFIRRRCDAGTRSESGHQSRFNEEVSKHDNSPFEPSSKYAGSFC